MEKKLPLRGAIFHPSWWARVSTTSGSPTKNIALKFQRNQQLDKNNPRAAMEKSAAARSHFSSVLVGARSQKSENSIPPVISNITKTSVLPRSA